MKKILLITIAFVVLSSCRKADELPPLTEGYATDVILPDPENLTQQERDFLEELEAEYENATK